MTTTKSYTVFKTSVIDLIQILFGMVDALYSLITNGNNAGENEGSKMTLNLIMTVSSIGYFGLTMVLALGGVIAQDLLRDDSKTFTVQA